MLVDEAEEKHDQRMRPELIRSLKTDLISAAWSEFDAIKRDEIAQELVVQHADHKANQDLYTTLHYAGAWDVLTSTLPPATRPLVRYSDPARGMGEEPLVSLDGTAPSREPSSAASWRGDLETAKKWSDQRDSLHLNAAKGKFTGHHLLWTR